MNWRRKSRLRRSPFDLPLILLVFFGFNFVTTGIIIISTGTTTGNEQLGIFGTVFAVYTFLFGVLHISSLIKPKRICVLGYSESFFWSNIKKGLEDTITKYNNNQSKRVVIDKLLRKSKLIELEQLTREEDDSLDAKEFIIKKLKELQRRRDVHGLVIRFESEDKQISRLLADLTAKGFFIVVVSVKVPNKYFYIKNLQPPKFVSTDFYKGGELVSDVLLGLDDSIGLDGIILISGPTKAYPNHLRTLTACYYTVMRKRHNLKIHIVTLDSFRRANFTKDHLEDALKALNARMKGLEGKNVAIYSGNDNLGGKISQLISAGKLDTSASNVGLYNKEFHIIGFDKTKDRNGDFIYEEYKYFHATINTKPIEKGHNAAQFLTDEFDGLIFKGGDKADPENWEKNILTKPEIVYSPIKETTTQTNSEEPTTTPASAIAKDGASSDSEDWRTVE